MSERDYQKLLDASFRFLSYRPRSEKEMQDFLRKKNLDLADKVAQRLRELGYIDDFKFVAWWVSQRQGRKPKGKSLIIAELLSKGVARNIIEDISSSNIENQKELAIRAILNKRHLWEKMPTLIQKKKIYDYLGRRGFHSDIIHRVVDEVMKNEVE